MTCETIPPIAPACRQGPRAAAAGRSWPAPVARIARWLRRAWRGYWDRRARRATVMILLSLDRRTLHDIGISPSEIESLVRDVGDRCRHYHPDWPRRRWWR